MLRSLSLVLSFFALTSFADVTYECRFAHKNAQEVIQESVRSLIVGAGACTVESFEAMENYSATISLGGASEFNGNEGWMVLQIWKDKGLIAHATYENHPKKGFVLSHVGDRGEFYEVECLKVEMMN